MQLRSWNITKVPAPNVEEFDLEFAVEVWRNPSMFQIMDIQHALTIVRYWHADAVDRLRRVPRDSEDWADIKHEEELLEVYMVSLKDALWVTAHANKMSGGM